jgi:hypothetical protein
MFVLGGLFAPLALAVCVARAGVSAQASLLEVGWGWQAVFLLTLIMPVVAMRRLQLLKAPTRPPSIME